MMRNPFRRQRWGVLDTFDKTVIEEHTDKQKATERAEELTACLNAYRWSSGNASAVVVVKLP